MALKKCARYLTLAEMEGKMRLPQEAKQPTLENIKNLLRGDYLKVGVTVHGHREIFWTKFVMMEGNNLVGRISNDLHYSELHGLFDEELITFPADCLLAIMDNH
ncbi:hypothetical protein D3C76_28140 [compost metagenome]